MKSLLILSLVSLMTASVSFADGFECMTLKKDLSVNVYNNTDPAEGTRVGAVMIVSDPNVAPGNQTIATFSDTNGLLNSKNLKYTANVDSRYKGTDRGGENILGTKLAMLKKIDLKLAFTYAAPVANGAVVSGKLTLTKERGKGRNIVRYVDCRRYLVNGQ